MDTSEYYGGTYPEPHEVIDEEPQDWDIDEYYELKMIGELE